MSPRHFLIGSTLSLAPLAAFALFAAPQIAGAQETAIPDVANSKNSFIGKINAEGVNVRCGPGDNYYPTQKLDKDVEVTVVGIKFDWLKIEPPKGSFSYVAKAFVDKQGDIGTVSREEVNVRTGSTLNALKTMIQAKLDKGQQVQIVGEQDEYYKITPPAGAYLFVNKQFVQPVRALPQVAGAGGAGAQQQPAQANGQQPQQPAGIIHEPGIPTPDSAQNTSAQNSQDSAPGNPDSTANGPTTFPADKYAAADPSAPAAATQPTADLLFDKLEADFAAASAKTIEQQPIKELLEGYNKILADATVPESLKRVADTRVRALTARNDVKDQFVATQKALEESKKRQQALKAEQEELTQQIAKNDVKMYAAVGTLRTSSFQSGQTTLYRLTDPGTGRTVAYIKSNDPKYTGLLNQFIGVRGDLVTDERLKMKTITPTEAEQVEQSKVNNSVIATITPPSLLPAAASVDQAPADGN